MTGRVGGRVLLASQWVEARDALNILSCTRPPPTSKKPAGPEIQECQRRPA